MNLFIALLLSSFGTDKLKDVKDDEINKIQEAIDRFKRFFNYFHRKIKCKFKLFSRYNAKNVQLESSKSKKLIFDEMNGKFLCLQKLKTKILI